jgi:hypothetical protein
MVVCTCHPSYDGDINRKIAIQGGLNKTLLKLLLKQKSSKHGSSHRATANQVQNPDFKLWYKKIKLVCHSMIYIIFYFIYYLYKQVSL